MSAPRGSSGQRVSTLAKTAGAPFVASAAVDGDEAEYSYYSSFYEESDGGGAVAMKSVKAVMPPVAVAGAGVADAAPAPKHSSLRLTVRSLKHATLHDESSSGLGGNPSVAVDYGPDQLIDLFPSNKKLYTQIGKINTIVSKVQSNLSTGPPGTPEDLAMRRKVWGENRLPASKQTSFLEFCYQTLQDFTLLLLITSAIVSIVLGVAVPHKAEKGEDDHSKAAWIEGAAILCAVALVVLVTSTNNYKKEQQFRKLNAKKESVDVTVLRANAPAPQKVSVFDLVVGDVLSLKTGAIIPVDGLYIRGNSCGTDESGQTGEPDMINKDKHKPFMLSGSFVKAGDCEMLVTGVGVNSTNGRTLMALRVADEETPLQIQLDVLAKQIGRLGMIAAVVLFVILICKYFVQKVDANDNVDDAVSSTLIKYLITCITIVVVAVPEGLPLAVTIALAYSMLKMLRDQNLVRRLSACETMGRATQICSDKTGTLTMNKMEVVDGWIAGSVIESDRTPASVAAFARRWTVPAAVEDSILFKIGQNVLINSAAEEVTSESGALVWTGSTTEMAMLTWFALAAPQWPSYQETRRSAGEPGTPGATKVRVLPFSSKMKRSSVVMRLSDGRFRWHFKGASEQVLAACTHVLNDTGATVPMTPIILNTLTTKISAMAGESLRTICMAYKDYAQPPADNFDEEDMAGLTCVGIVGIHDTLRPEVPAAVADCIRAGIKVRMVTGDNIDTARAIAKKCGIYDEDRGDVCVEGPDFAAMTNAELSHILDTLTVLARSSPLDKQRLVERLMIEKNEVVAVTGDGSNDGPALKRANVGFGMGITGTEIAKEAASIILMDDKFSSIVKAVKWGRNVYDSIRKFLQFQLTVNIVAVSLAFIGAVSNAKGESPLKAIQLLWVNLIMDTFAALALATEEPSESLLDRRPITNNDPLISITMWVHIIGQGVYQLTITLIILYTGQNWFKGIKQYSTEHFTVIFNVFVLMQLGNEFNCRVIDQSLNCFKGIHKNWLYLSILFGTAVVQAIIVEFGSDWLQTKPLTGPEWGVSIAFFFGSMIWGFCLRLLPNYAPEFRPRDDDKPGHHA